MLSYKEGLPYQDFVNTPPILPNPIEHILEVLNILLFLYTKHFAIHIYLSAYLPI